LLAKAKVLGLQVYVNCGTTIKDSYIQKFPSRFIVLGVSNVSTSEDLETLKLVFLHELAHAELNLISNSRSEIITEEIKVWKTVFSGLESQGPELKRFLEFSQECINSYLKYR
jgi:hypothetical protein